MTAASPCDHEVRRDEREYWQDRNEMRDRQGSDQTRRVRSGLHADTDLDEIRRIQAPIVQVRAHTV